MTQLAAAALYLLSAQAAQARLIVNPAPGNHILHEESFSVKQAKHDVYVESDVAVTVQRYSKYPLIDVGIADVGGADGGIGSSGLSGVGADEVKVVISSNCDTTQTTLVPLVTMEGNFIKISTGVSAKAQEESRAPTGVREFLESTWYQLTWSYTSNLCRRLQATTAPGGAAAADQTLNNYCGKTWMEAYESCSTPCPTGVECDALGDGSMCQRFTTCWDRLSEGSGVDGGEGGLSTTGLGVNATGEVNGTVPTTVAAQASDASLDGTVIATLPTQTTQSASLEALANDTETNETGLFDATKPATPAATSVLTTVSAIETANPSESTGSTISSATLPDAATLASTNETEIVASTDASSGATTMTANETDINDGMFNETTIQANETDSRPTIGKPTHAPRPSAYSPTISPQPTTLTYTPTFVPTSENSATRYGLAFTLFTGVLSDSVAALAVGAFALRKQSASTSLKVEEQTCKYHVDILNECNTIRVEAPATRMIDAVLKGVSADQAGCVTEYEGKLVFPGTGWKLDDGVVESKC
jgi:hypothetical protein